MTDQTSNPRAVFGDNSGSTESIEGGQLLAFVERIENLEEDKRQTAEDIKDVYAEAKGTGFDVKVIRKVIARRRADRDKLAEEEQLIALYEQAIRNCGR